jgi:hypothetical protein
VDRGTQDGVCTVADEALPLLPQRRTPGESLAVSLAVSLGGDGAEPTRALPDLDVLQQVLAGLRRLI